MASITVRYLVGAALVLLAGAVWMWPASTARAAGPVLQWHEIVSEFPDGFRVKARATSDSAITSIQLRLRIGQQVTHAYDYLDYSPGKLAEGELFWRTNTGSRYIAPGTIIRYTFEIEDSAGQSLTTKLQEFVYFDARFVDDEGNSRWQELSDGAVTVAYKGPVKKRAEEVLRTITETLDKMIPIMGPESVEEPIRVTMYNNVKEMLEALPPKSAAISRELITEGQAFVEYGTLLVLGGGRLALGTASHEVMHIITHRVGASVIRRVPSWLSEGLSEFANVDPGYAYDIALDFAIETDRLLPHVYMPVMPGDPENVIIFYGQAKSIVRMMIGVFGPEKMRQFMANLKTGKNMDDSLIDVYGVDRAGLDAMWRTSIGAEVLDVTSRRAVRPTAVPQRVPLLYSLTPQAQSEVVGDQAAEPTPTPTSTPEPEPTPTPIPTPTPDPTASPVPEAAVAAPTEAAPTTAPASQSEPQQTGSGGSACNPSPGGGPTDLGFLALFVGLAGLGLRRKRRG